MCHKKRFVQVSFAPVQRQTGFLMPLALFILVGLGALAIAISRLGAGQFSSAVQETLSVQAFYAAESASQVAMHRILFNTSTKTDADLKCAAANGNTLNFSVAGLNECSARIICSAVSNTGDAAGIYRIETISTCGDGNLLTERRVVAAVRYE